MFTLKIKTQVAKILIDRNIGNSSVAVNNDVNKPERTLPINENQFDTKYSESTATNDAFNKECSLVKGIDAARLAQEDSVQREGNIHNLPNINRHKVAEDKKVVPEKYSSDRSVKSLSARVGCNYSIAATFSNKNESRCQVDRAPR